MLYFQYFLPFSVRDDWRTALAKYVAPGLGWLPGPRLGRCSGQVKVMTYIRAGCWYQETEESGVKGGRSLVQSLLFHGALTRAAENPRTQHLEKISTGLLLFTRPKYHVCTEAWEGMCKWLNRHGSNVKGVNFHASKLPRYVLRHNIDSFVL